MIRGAHPDKRSSAEHLAGLAAGDDHRHRAVIDPRGVAGGRHSAFLQRPQAGECSEVGLGARMLVFRDRYRPASPARHLDRENLASKEAIGLGRGVIPLRGLGECVAGLARDLIIAGQVVGSLRHRIGTKLTLDLRVREAGADRRIV